MRDSWSKKYWEEQSSKNGLRSVIDPNDADGKKNINLNSIWKKNTEKFLRSNRVSNVSSLLDFGCGIGRNYPVLSKVSANYIGVDIAFGMLKKAEGMRCLVDGIYLPFQESSFDLIFSFLVLQHIPDDENLFHIITEFHRCLKKDGLVIICERSSNMETEENMSENYIKRRLPTEYIEMFLSRGFKLKKVKKMNIKMSWRDYFKKFNEAGENLYSFVRR